MRRNSALKLLNPVLALLLIAQVSTGLAHDVIPHEAFEGIHGTIGILLAVVAVTHIVLNRAWIAATYFRKADAV